jgi:hypothetical protein
MHGRPSLQGAMNAFYGSIPVQKLFNANDDSTGTVTIAGANVTIAASIYLDVALGTWWIAFYQSCRF